MNNSTIKVNIEQSKRVSFCNGFASVSPMNRGFSHSSQHKNKPIQTKVYIGLLVRWKGLEPSTYWFVAVSIAVK